MEMLKYVNRVLSASLVVISIIYIVSVVRVYDAVTELDKNTITMTEISEMNTKIVTYLKDMSELDEDLASLATLPALLDGDSGSLGDLYYEEDETTAEATEAEVTTAEETYAETTQESTKNYNFEVEQSTSADLEGTDPSGKPYKLLDMWGTTWYLQVDGEIKGSYLDEHNVQVYEWEDWNGEEFELGNVG